MSGAAIASVLKHLIARWRRARQLLPCDLLDAGLLPLSASD
jgi:hypothetical protein